MNYWLLKSEPDVWSIEQQKDAGSEGVAWDGVRNYQAANNLRSMLINLCKENNYQSVFPPIEICGDNAAMIAMVGLEKYKLKLFNKLDHPAKPRWPLDENALFLKGAGVKL